MKKDKTKEEPSLKTCTINPRHIWMANIAHCPYCAFTPEQRVDWAIRTEWGTKKSKGGKVD